jgi:Zn-dependent protease with chaperone function
MQNAASWLLFLMFALVLVGMYLGIRRRWLSPALIAAIGVVINIVIMTVVGIAEGNTIYQAVFVGFLIGGLFSVAVLAIAWFFQRSEARRRPE